MGSRKKSSKSMAGSQIFFFLVKKDVRAVRFDSLEIHKADSVGLYFKREIEYLKDKKMTETIERIRSKMDNISGQCQRQLLSVRAFERLWMTSMKGRFGPRRKTRKHLKNNINCVF